MNKKGIESLKSSLDRLTESINSFRPKTITTKERKAPAEDEFISERKFKVITIRCCMKCGRELAELKLIEPGELYTCETCKNRNSEYSQTFEGKLHSIIESKKCLYEENFDVIPARKEDVKALIYEILHAFNDETKKITSYRKWTDEDVKQFAILVLEPYINNHPLTVTSSVFQKFNDFKQKKNETNH